MSPPSTGSAFGSSREHYVHLTVPVMLLVCLPATILVSRSVYKRLVMEDGPVKYATVVAYLFAFLWGLVLTRKLRAKRDVGWAVLYAVLSFGFLFIAMEEISWGQRIFRIESPEFFT